MKIGIARLFTKNCNIKYNFKIIEKLYNNAINLNLEIIIFPRLSISGFSINDKFLDDKFLEEVILYTEKLIELTENKKTKILIGTIYYEKDYQENNNIFKKVLKDSAIFIDNSYIDDVVFRKEIDKLNILNDYRYFDKNNFLKNFEYQKKKFTVLLSDDIFSNFNVFLASDSKPDYIVCLDSSIRDITYKKKHLIKLSKFVNAPVFYINNATNFNNYLFKGEIILINEDFEIVYSDIYKDDSIFEFEIDCEDGTELFIKNKKIENKTLYYLLKKIFGKNKIILDYNSITKTEIKDIEKYSQNFELVSFDKKKIDGVKNIDIGNYVDAELYEKLDDSVKDILKQKVLMLDVKI